MTPVFNNGFLKPWQFYHHGCCHANAHRVLPRTIRITDGCKWSQIRSAAESVQHQPRSQNSILSRPHRSRVRASPGRCVAQMGFITAFEAALLMKWTGNLSGRNLDSWLFELSSVAFVDDSQIPTRCRYKRMLNSWRLNDSTLVTSEKARYLLLCRWTNLSERDASTAHRIDNCTDITVLTDGILLTI